MTDIYFCVQIATNPEMIKKKEKIPKLNFNGYALWVGLGVDWEKTNTKYEGKLI